MKFLDGFTEQAYAVMRIMTGLLFMQYGTQKLLNFPSEFSRELDGLMMAAGGIELVGGLLVAIGLATRPVAFICAGMSAVGYWLAHGMNDFFPINNGGTTITLFCFAFLYISTKGAGIWSADAMMGKSEG